MEILFEACRVICCGIFSSADLGGSSNFYGDREHYAALMRRIDEIIEVGTNNI